MDIRKKIKLAMIESGVERDKDLAGLCGWSSSNLHDRFVRNAWRVSDLEMIADILGYDLVVEFVKKSDKEKEN